MPNKPNADVEIKVTDDETLKAAAGPAIGPGSCRKLGAHTLTKEGFHCSVTLGTGVALVTSLSLVCSGQPDAVVYPVTAGACVGTGSAGFFGSFWAKHGCRNQPNRQYREIPEPSSAAVIGTSNS